MGSLLEEFRKIDEESKEERGEKKKRGVEEKLKKIIEFISLQKNLADFPQEDFAREEGAAHIVARRIKNKMKINQLRKFFTQIKKVDNEIKGEDEDAKIEKTKILPLFPELAYACGRGLITKDFYRLLKECLDKISYVKDFRRLVEFLSAILAYYKMETQ